MLGEPNMEVRWEGAVAWLMTSRWGGVRWGGWPGGRGGAYKLVAASASVS